MLATSHDIELKHNDDTVRGEPGAGLTVVRPALRQAQCERFFYQFNGVSYTGN